MEQNIILSPCDIKSRTIFGDVHDPRILHCLRSLTGSFSCSNFVPATYLSIQRVLGLPRLFASLTHGQRLLMPTWALCWTHVQHNRFFQDAILSHNRDGLNSPIIDLFVRFCFNDIYFLFIYLTAQ